MIVVIEFPKASELNQILYDRVCENLRDWGDGRGPGGLRTGWNFHEQKIKEIDELTSWITHILPNVSKHFAIKPKDLPPHLLGDVTLIENKMCGYNVNAFEIAECWGIHYNRDDKLSEHCHFPYTLSFVYYVKTPKGSSPIIIENETHDIKEGQCVFFLATQYHGVGQNDCDGRCAIVGNILYRF